MSVLTSENLTWTPTVTAAGGNVTVTNLTSVGQYIVVGKIVFFMLKIDSATISKSSTLSESCRITLPRVRSANPAVNAVATVKMENSSIISNNANTGIIPPGTNYVEIYYLPSTGAKIAISFSVLGLALINTPVNITHSIEISGFYNID